jgi:cold shock CspA family protein
MRGNMIWFNAAKGHGFISTEHDERLYVDAAGFVLGNLPVGRCAGRAVTFERRDDDDSVHAVNVAFVIEAEPRRARRRRHETGRSN